jgi:hypothetical protein
MEDHENDAITGSFSENFNITDTDAGSPSPFGSPLDSATAGFLPDDDVLKLLCII